MRFVPVGSLKEGMILAKDIANTSKTYMLRKGVELREEYIRYLADKGYLGAYIADADSELVEIEDPISFETLENGITAVQESNVQALLDVSTAIVRDLAHMGKLSVDLLDLRSYDDYTYHHSVNVAVYAVAVGTKLGMGKSDLELLSMAALAHDLGKGKIPEEIIKKPEKLTDEEYAIVKQHPKFSYDILYENSEIPASVRQAVLFHHENENGTGYPMGKESSEIPFMAKIIHAVDVYDALTSKRPYKEPYTSAAAFDYMNGGKGVLFDAKVVEAMELVIPAYPPGIEVGLSNGQRGLVVAHSANAHRPIISLSDTKEVVNLNLDPRYKDVFIVSSGVLSLDYSQEVSTLNEGRSAVKEREKTVIIVDDSSLNLAQAKAALQGENYNVVALASGVAALNYVNAKGAPDLIIIDIEMPILNGLRLAETLRANGHTALPIIFLTGISNREMVLKCKAVNACDYILKPANPTYLKARVAMALGITQER